MESGLSLSEMYSSDEFQDLQAENETLRSLMEPAQLAKAAMKNVENIKLPYILKDKLVMNEGVHNDLLYTKAELLDEDKFATETEFNLICDHLDTRQNAGVANYAGLVLNRHWKNSGKDGAGTYADLHIMDEGLAKKLALGAKFGISPTFDFDKINVEGQDVATNLSTVSYSLVLDPAVKETMLNNKQGGGKMPLRNEEELAAQKKLPYKYPFKNKNKEGKELASELEVDEKTLAVLQHAEGLVKELSEYKEGIVKDELEHRAENIVINELMMGRIEEDELDERIESLQGKSIEVLEEVENIIGDNVELSAWTDFIKSYRKKKPGASFKEIAKAFKSKKAENAKHPNETPEEKKKREDEEEKRKKAAENDAGEITTPENELQGLIDNSQAAAINKQQSELQKTIANGGRSELDAKFAETLFGPQTGSGGAQ